MIRKKFPFTGEVRGLTSEGQTDLCLYIHLDTAGERNNIIMLQRVANYMLISVV